LGLADQRHQKGKNPQRLDSSPIYATNGVFFNIATDIIHHARGLEFIGQDRNGLLEWASMPSSGAYPVMLAHQPGNRPDLAEGLFNRFIAIRVDQAAGCRRKEAAG
jgi:hypothetical protein